MGKWRGKGDCFEDQRDMSMFIKTEPLMKKLKIEEKDRSWNLLLR